MGRVTAWATGLILVALLIGGLIPEVQNARESARKATAVNKMHQIGLALETKHDAFKKVESVSLASALVDDSQSARESGEGDAASIPAKSDRKIVYSAAINLAVEDFSGVAEKVDALAKKFDGYVADSNIAGATGETRRGTWKIRVPVAHFQEFVAAAKGLGELVSAGTSSRDVSEEYYDVDARIRNKTKEEERLLKLLEERPGKLADVIAIERELSRVREELERMQGRMRVLADLTSLTTADLTITEIHNYKPEDAPTLTTRVHRSFDDSVETLAATGANVLVIAAGAVVWLPLVAIAIGAGYAAVRAGRRKKAAAPATKAEP